MIVFVAASFLLVLALPLPWASASSDPPNPTAAPAIASCSVAPDPRIDTFYPCTNQAGASGFVNSSVRFDVSVGGDAGENTIVSFHFDVQPNATNPLGPPILNPDSPPVNFIVVSPETGIPVSVQTNRTYTQLSNDSSNPNRYWVYIEARGEDGEFDPTRGGGTLLFPVLVYENIEPYVDNFQSVYGASVDFPDPQIPALTVNVNVTDPDLDAVTMTWDWGDGTTNVSQTVLFDDYPVAISVTHRYDRSLFPLNETPRIVRFPIILWLDDGNPGHNVSQTAVAEFDVERDAPPQIGAEFTPTVGSRFKAGDPVFMEATATDPEGDPVETWWDFDDATDSDGDGDPTTDRDAVGSTASHVYDVPGDYTITFLASDGDTKKDCSVDLENCATFFARPARRSTLIFVRANQLPVLAIANHTALAHEPVLLRVAAFDPDGDGMVVTWDFGDGSTNATNVTAGQPGAPTVQELFQDHVYVTPSVCPTNPRLVCPTILTVSVFDGTDTVIVTRSVFVEAFNLPPVIRGLAILRENRTVATNSTFQYNSIAVLRLNMSDEEGDPLNVTIDWGDGTISTAEVTLAGEGNATTVVATGDVDECRLNETGHIACFFSHRYGDIGDAELRGYLIAVIVRDGQLYADIDPEDGTMISLSHVIRDFANLQVTHARIRGLGPWDSWDYGTLAVAAGLPIGLLSRAAWRIRKERAEE